LRFGLGDKIIQALQRRSIMDREPTRPKLSKKFIFTLRTEMAKEAAQAEQ